MDLICLPIPITSLKFLLQIPLYQGHTYSSENDQYMSHQQLKNKYSVILLFLNFVVISQSYYLLKIPPKRHIFYFFSLFLLRFLLVATILTIMQTTVLSRWATEESVRKEHQVDRRGNPPVVVIDNGVSLKSPQLL